MPMSALLMLFISEPLVFGMLRSTGIGQRDLMGNQLGIGFYLLTRLVGQMGQVYEVTPLVPSFGPGIIVLIIGYRMIRRL